MIPAPRKRFQFSIPGWLILATLVLTSGCGSSSPHRPAGEEAAKTGLQVAEDAAAALNRAGAVHLAGTVPDTAASVPDRVDIEVETEGSTGTFVAGGVEVNLVRVKGITYLKAPASYYVRSGISRANASKAADRWLRMPADSSANRAFVFSDLVKSMTTQESGTIISKVTTGSVHEQRVVIVSETDGSRLYVAAQGTPFPLRETGSAHSAGTKSDLTLSGFGKHVKLAAPAGAVDVTKLIPQ